LSETLRALGCIGQAESRVQFAHIDIEPVFTDVNTDIDTREIGCGHGRNTSALLNSGYGPIRLFELSIESESRHTLVNCLGEAIIGLGLR